MKDFAIQDRQAFLKSTKHKKESFAFWWVLCATLFISLVGLCVTVGPHVFMGN